MKSRITEAIELDYNKKFPLLLRNESLFTNLIIFHGGVEITFCKIREKYWIVRGRQNVRKILKKCYVCNIVQEKTLKPVETPTLPWYRVSCNHAFENVGLDFAGPLYYMNNHTDKESRKCYILLFTCCFSRSIHLELTIDISSKTFLLALRRFISKCGCPKIIVSDNLNRAK